VSYPTRSKPIAECVLFSPVRRYGRTHTQKLVSYPTQSPLFALFFRCIPLVSTVLSVRRHGRTYTKKLVSYPTRSELSLQSELSHSIRAVIAKSALLFPVYFPCLFPVCRPCRYRRTPNTPQNQKVLICTRNTISDPCRSRYQEPGDNSMPHARRPKKPCLCSRSAL